MVSRHVVLLIAALAVAPGAGLTVNAANGAPSVAPSERASISDMRDTAIAINATMRRYHYNPRELDQPEYRQIEAAVLALGHSATDSDAFIAGFREIWKDAPFSHVNLTKARGTAEETAAYLDQMTVGADAVRLEWAGDDAVLTVNTMMGSDTVTAIDAAFASLHERGAARLIIDLRSNEGGAFAVRPLLGHLLDKPYDAGLFVSQKWYADNDGAPQADDMVGLTPWTGWSIRRFWADVADAPLTRIQFTPSIPVFEGPVYVLTSRKTASAAELASDALQAAARATIVGERTAGAMLSQKPFDIPGGVHLFLPIADYYSLANGRIEGRGVAPDIAVDADKALELVRAMAE
ncbi:MAG: S41 family peptidase [Pseudomonadota bacterium]